MGVTILLGFVFLIVKYFEYSHKFENGLFPSTNNFLAIYFTLTGLHMLHVLGGMAVNAYLLGPGREALEDEPGVVHQPGRELGPLLALRGSGLDLPLPDPVSAVGGIHDDERHARRRPRG